MISLFKRRASGNAIPGAGMLAVRIADGAALPAGCVGVVCDQGGGTRRLAPGARAALQQGETAFCFHPGPYTFDLLPFAAAPEIGLRVSFAVDSPDPRVAQQRFDLYLASEAGGAVSLAAMAEAMQLALQRELAQGNLELPPCTTPAEWDAFRAGLNQLLYTRFGVSVDDCIPVDLGERVDYAQILLARAAAPAAPDPVAPVRVDPQPSDAQALRRLFLELPSITCALRLAELPSGQALFRQHQDLLQRLDLIGLSVATMPALELAAPGQALSPDQQTRRARHSAAAAVALDEAWSLLARLSLAGLEPLLDEADRIVANLELHSSARRVVDT